MKKIRLFLLVCIVLSLVLAGCGSDSSNSTPASPASVKPATTVVPFGVESMRMPMNDGTTTVTDFTYNDAGQVIEVTLSQEFDEDGDGRADSILTATFTLDPGIVVTQVPELEELSDVRVALAKARKIFIPEISTSFGDMIGAVVKSVAEYHSYEGIRAALVPDGMVIYGRYTRTYDYDEAGRLVTAHFVGEDSEANQSNTLSLTFDDNGRLIKAKSINQYDLYKDGWIEENHVMETNYAYDEAGKLVEKVGDDFGSPYLDTTTYTYNEVGQLSVEDYKHIYRKDGSIDTQNTTTNTYDEDGNLAEEIQNNYYYAEGDTKTLSSRYITTYSYDESGRVLRKLLQEDNDADPSTIDLAYSHTYVYGEFGVISFEYRFEYSSGFGNSTVYDYTYDGQGRLTGKRQMNDNNNDGVADSFVIGAYAYDADGRLCSLEDSNHSAVAGDLGPAYWKETRAFTYDADGRFNGYAIEHAGNGTDVDQRLAAGWAYDEEGKSAAGTFQDFNWDATADAGAGALVADGPAKTMSFSFAAGAPTATMAIEVQQLPYNDYQPKDFEKITLSIKVPALYGLLYTAQMQGPK